MKKVAFGLIFLLLAIGIGIASRPTGHPEVVILSPLESTSRLWSHPSEEIVFSLAFSIEATMFVAADYLLDATLTDLNTTLPLNVKSIRGPTTVFEWDETPFHLYEFAFELGLSPQPGFQVQLMDTVLNLTYVEGIQFALPIGNFAFLVEEVQVESPLSLVRMYGRKEFGECNGIQYVMIGLENLSAVPITIHAISSGFSQLEWRPLRVAMEHPPAAIDQLKMFGEAIIEPRMTLPGNGVQYFVWERIGSMVGLARFYLDIEYRMLGETHRFLLDDFIYYQDFERGECFERRFVETRYVYPR